MRFFRWSWARWLQFKEWFKPLSLETLLFIIALGSANVQHVYLIRTGSADTWQLTIAVYAVELLIVWASLWGSTGLVISTVLFLVSMIAVRHTFNVEWFGHMAFSLAVYCGSIGNYVRRKGYVDLVPLLRVIRRRRAKETYDITGYSSADIRDKFFISLEKAAVVKQMFAIGLHITSELIDDLRRA